VSDHPQSPALFQHQTEIFDRYFPDLLFHRDLSLDPDQLAFAMATSKKL